MGSELDSDLSVTRGESMACIESLTHDLSNQVMVIQGNASLLQLKAAESPEIRELVEQILNASQNAVQLIRQLSEKASDLQAVGG